MIGMAGIVAGIMKCMARQGKRDRTNEQDSI